MAKKRAPRLTQADIAAIVDALNAALAGDGFDGGDFEGLNREDFERALNRFLALYPINPK